MSVQGLTRVGVVAHLPPPCSGRHYHAANYADTSRRRCIFRITAAAAALCFCSKTKLTWNLLCAMLDDPGLMDVFSLRQFECVDENARVQMR